MPLLATPKIDRSLKSIVEDRCGNQAGTAGSLPQLQRTLAAALLCRHVADTDSQRTEARNWRHL